MILAESPTDYLVLLLVPGIDAGNCGTSEPILWFFVVWRVQAALADHVLWKLPRLSASDFLQCVHEHPHLIILQL